MSLDMDENVEEEMVENEKEKEVVDVDVENLTPIDNEKIAKCENNSATNYKLTSSVWNHFTKNDKKPGKEPTASCNYCKRPFKCASKYGTSSLSRHIQRCKDFPKWGQNKRQKLLTFSSPQSNINGEPVISVWEFNQDKCRKGLAEMIIIDEKPFKIVEHEGLKRWVSMLQPQFKWVARKTIANDCLAIYEAEKKKLKKFFENKIQRVSLTTDLWTSISNDSYMCLTAHYIDDEWKLHKKIINFCMLPPPHTGDAIAQAVEDCLLSWGLNRITTLTVDNASANDVALKILRKMLVKRGFLAGEGDHFHVRCAAHIVNLIVREGLNEVNESINRIRRCVRFVRGSPQREYNFKVCCEKEGISSKLGLCMDVPTRWNSTFLMLGKALKYQKVFDRLVLYDAAFAKEDTPNDNDWKIGKAMCSFLEHFYEVTTTLSGTSYVTSSLYLDEVHKIESLLFEFSTSEDLILRDMSRKMKQKFDKYWGSFDKINMWLLVANVLDPRCKLKFLKFCYSQIYDVDKVKEIINSVNIEFETLFKFYEAKFSAATKTKIEAPTQTKTKGPSRLAYLKFLAVDETENEKTEIHRYLEEHIVVEDDNFDILAWWKVNAYKYKVLSHMARDLLAIPVSTVASESAFSTSGRVLDSYRSSLSPKLVECLICAQDWMRSKPKVDEYQEDAEELTINFTAIQNEVGEGSVSSPRPPASASASAKGKGIVIDG